MITELSVGGSQTALLRLLEKIDQNRFSPSVACLYDGDGETGRRIRGLSIDVTDLAMTKTSLFSWLRLYRLLRQQRPLILHCWLFHPSILGRILGRMARVPIIITSRRNDQVGGTLREYVNRWSGGLSDRTIAVSESARTIEIQRAKVPPDQVMVIPNGIETEKFSTLTPEVGLEFRRRLNISAEVPLLGSVGRLHEQKGYNQLIRAMVKIRARVPKARLLLVGEGECRGDLERLARDLGVTEAVIFTGKRMDIPQIMSALDVFVLSSLWEGMPNVILEAMAAGRPVVATRVGGVPEVVTDDVTGLLVSPRDPTALAEACIRLLRDTRLQDRLGSQARRHVLEHFQVDAAARSTEALYEALLQDKLRMRYVDSVDSKGWIPNGTS